MSLPIRDLPAPSTVVPTADFNVSLPSAALYTCPGATVSSEPNGEEDPNPTGIHRLPSWRPDVRDLGRAELGPPEVSEGKSDTVPA